MKRNFFKILILLLICIIVIGTPHSSLADNSKSDNSSSKGTTIDTDITTDNFTEFNPNKSNGKINQMTDPFVNVITPVVQKVLGLLKLFSGFIMVISLALFGLYRVLAANPELTRDLGITSIVPKNTKILMDAGRAVIIGSILVFSSSSVVELVMNIFLGG